MLEFAISIPWIISVLVAFALGYWIGAQRGFKKGAKDD